MELDTNNHSVFSLNYHLILVIKYRRSVITAPISERLKEIFEYIPKNILKRKVRNEVGTC